MPLKAGPWSAQLKKLARHVWRFATAAAVSTGWKGCRLAQTTDAHASTKSRTPGPRAEAVPLIFIFEPALGPMAEMGAAGDSNPISSKLQWNLVRICIDCCELSVATSGNRN
jgi:hypothetical protein